jgi:hypothetical protein
MHYYLYFPGATGITDEHLARCGLEDLARGQSPTWFEPPRGPDGKRGMACTWLRGNGDDPPLGIVESQKWTPCRPAAIPGGKLEAGAYWVGVDRERPVRPEDIERAEPFAGHRVPLDDDQIWTVPIARRLPHCHGLDDRGAYCRQIHPRFAAFWQRSESFAAELLTVVRQLTLMATRKGAKPTDTLNAQFDMAETFDFAVEALAMNYRLNAELVTTLGLLDDCGLLDVVKAVVDLPTLIGAEREKKKGSSEPARERVSIPVGLSI